jgi:membrane protease subunit HflK
MKNEGQAYANDVVPRARGTASRLMEEASGYKTEVVQRAEGDASRFREVVTEYQKAPGVTRDRLYLDMMQSVLGNSSKILIDQKNGSNLLNLPLSQLLQQGAVAATVPPVDVGAVPPRVTAPEQSGASDASRSRDALRSREGR